MLEANRSISDLQPEMQACVWRWLDLCHAASINVVITETKRSKARQLFLYAKGRVLPKGLELKYLGYDDPAIDSKPKEKQVTWTLQSKHLDGLAIDFGFKVGGKFTYNGDWDAAYNLAEQSGLKSLFRSSGVDRPHLELDPNPNREILEKLFSDKALILNNALADFNHAKEELAKNKGVKFNPSFIAQ